MLVILMSAAFLFFYINGFGVSIRQPLLVCTNSIAGVRVAVVQEYFDWGDFSTSFFVEQDNFWYEYYLEHEGHPWRDVEVRLNQRNGDFEIFHHKRLVGSFDPRSGQFKNSISRLNYTHPGGYIKGDLTRNWDKMRYDPDILVSAFDRSRKE
jgi:hypothetical protein